jgi:hypothetical protein
MTTVSKSVPPRRPVKASSIVLREIRTLHQSHGPEEDSVTSTCTVADKIEEMVLKIGYTNAQALGVIVQLLTVGKVRVDFREYSLRLEVVSKSDVMTRAQAAEVFDSHLGQMKLPDKQTTGFTQKIVFQPPRIRLPR